MEFFVNYTFMSVHIYTYKYLENILYFFWI